MILNEVHLTVFLNLSMNLSTFYPMILEVTETTVAPSCARLYCARDCADVQLWESLASEISLSEQIKALMK